MILSKSREISIIGGLLLLVIAFLYLSFKGDKTELPRGALPTPTPVTLNEDFPDVPPLGTGIIKQDSYLATNELGEVIFNVPLIITPREAFLFTATGVPMKKDEASLVAKSFAVYENEQKINDDIFMWRSDDYTKFLTIYLQSSHISYTDSFVPAKADIGSPSNRRISSASDASNIAVDFLRNRGLLKEGLHVDQENIETLKETSEGAQKVSFEEATIVSIPFTRKLGSAQVIYQLGRTHSVIVWVDKFGTVRKLEHQYAGALIDSNRLLLNRAEVFGKIKNGQATIVKYGDNAEGVPMPTIAKTTFTNLVFSYFYDIEAGIFLPVYKLTGRVTTRANTTEDLVVVLPALK